MRSSGSARWWAACTGPQRCGLPPGGGWSRAAGGSGSTMGVPLCRQLARAAVVASSSSSSCTPLCHSSSGGRSRRAYAAMTAPSATTTAKPRRAVRVCVVGSGPGGFYAVEALQRLMAPPPSAPSSSTGGSEPAGAAEEAAVEVAEVDVYERQAVPYGLVRFGVAPDHPEVKAVQHRYDAFMADPRLRFIGNVSVTTATGSPAPSPTSSSSSSVSSSSSSSSSSVSVGELLEAYDAVILAVGAQRDRPLGVPGEDLPAVYSAREFVAWYNGDPRMADRHFELASSREAVVVGQGNVALDVARILLHEPDQLATTDIATYACDALRRSQISTVHIIGRRGPAQASFTNKEVREILNMPNVECHFLPSGVLSLNEASKAEISKERGKKRMVDLFASTEKKTNEKIAAGEQSKKKLYFHFMRSPTRFLPNDDKRVGSVELAVNELRGEAGNQKAVPTGENEVLKCDVVFKSIGYKSEPLEGVPFDEDRGVVPNERGRVVRADGSAMGGLYVSGWMKRGPSGVIGTNRTDAEETVAVLWQDLCHNEAASRSEKKGWTAIECKLQERGVSYVQWNQWKAIEAEEHRRGQVLGKERDKITSLTEQLHLAGKH